MNNTEPKPATGECPHDLAERETACADGMCPICANATLAAERERTDWLWSVIKQIEGGTDLISQLAAERERFAFEHTHSEALQIEVKQLRAQLAAAEAAMKYIRLQADCWTNTGDIRSLRDAMKSFVAIIDKGGEAALAAAIAEATKPLVDALAKIPEMLDKMPVRTGAYGIKVWIEDALAKVGNQPLVDALRNALGNTPGWRKQAAAALAKAGQ